MSGQVNKIDAACHTLDVLLQAGEAKLSNLTSDIDDIGQDAYKFYVFVELIGILELMQLDKVGVIVSCDPESYTSGYDLSVIQPIVDNTQDLKKLMPYLHKCSEFLNLNNLRYSPLLSEAIYSNFYETNPTSAQAVTIGYDKSGLLAKAEFKPSSGTKEALLEYLMESYSISRDHGIILELQTLKDKALLELQIKTNLNALLGESVILKI